MEFCLVFWISLPMLIDYREGSYLLALYEPIRSMLPVCATCQGDGYVWKECYTHNKSKESCPDCRATGRQLCTLNSGDVAIPGNGPSGPVLVGVEVKTFSDLISSMDSGRLQATQIPLMYEDYPDERWILVIGDYRPSPTDNALQTFIKQFVCHNIACPHLLDHPDKPYRFYDNYKRTPECPKCGIQNARIAWSNWSDYAFGGGTRPYSYLESFLSGPSLSRFNFRVKSVPDYETAAVWLSTIAASWSKPYSSHRSMKVMDESRRVVKHPMMDVRQYARLEHAMKLPGVGYELASEMAKTFTSVRSMYNADTDTLAEIATTSSKGRKVRMGKTRAEAINKYLS